MNPKWNHEHSAHLATRNGLLDVDAQLSKRGKRRVENRPPPTAATPERARAVTRTAASDVGTGTTAIRRSNVSPAASVNASVVVGR